MTEPDLLDPKLDAELREQRPRPSGRLRTELRQRLLELNARDRRPARLWLLVAAYTGSGAVLLVLAAFGASGGGPFGS
jgi:hypothetical protein